MEALGNKSYAEVSDIRALGIGLSSQQEETAVLLLSAASSKLRVIGKKYGKDLDEMCKDEDMKAAVKSTVIQAALRALNSIADSSPAVTQETQSALGYSASMTYLNAGQSLYFLRNELKDLGILRQTFGALEVYGNGTDDKGYIY